MPYTVIKGAEPVSLEGHGDRARVGVLLSHGFTGSTQSMRPWAEHLAEAGFTVELPRLPGHGTHWRELNRVRWQEWYGELNRTLADLRRRTEVVAVGGLSMGGTLATRLAQVHGDSIAGLLLVNPAYALDNPMLKYIGILKYFPGVPGIGSDIKKPGCEELCYPITPLRGTAELMKLFDVVRADLDKVTQPVMLWRSEEDHVVPAASSAYLLKHLGSADVTEHVLTDSYHVATIDNDAPTIFEESVAFLDRVVAARSN